jgi:hypothetical protein
VLAIAAACALGVAAWRRGVRDLADVLWWAAAALALRSAFESVMVAYYMWPALALAVVAAVRSWERLLASACAATVVTFVSQGWWRNVWTWWVPMMAGLALTLALARVTLPLGPRKGIAAGADSRTPPVGARYPGLD